MRFRLLNRYFCSATPCIVVVSRYHSRVLLYLFRSIVLSLLHVQKGKIQIYIREQNLFREMYKSGYEHSVRGYYARVWYGKYYI